MKLNKNFLVHNSGGEAMLVPTGKADFSGIVRGNKTFGAILELLSSNTDITEDALIEAMKERFDAPAGVIERDVQSALTELRKIGSIDD